MQLWDEHRARRGSMKGRAPPRAAEAADSRVPASYLLARAIRPSQAFSPNPWNHWRARRDSNPRPLPPEGSALSS